MPATALLIDGCVAVAVLVIGLTVRFAPTVATAIALLGVGYGAYVVVNEPALDLAAAAYGAGLLATAELAYWSLELRGGVADEPGAYPRRVSVIALLSLGGLALAALVLALVEAAALEGIAIEIVGATAALAMLALVWAGLRRAQ